MASPDTARTVAVMTVMTARAATVMTAMTARAATARTVLTTTTTTISQTNNDYEAHQNQRAGALIL